MSSNAPTDGDAPSLFTSHAKYAQGAISSTLGYESGEQTKKEAVEDMKKASAQSSGQPSQIPVLGSAEKKLGEVTGCEGMEKDGDARIPEKRGLEEQSGTG